MKKRVKYSIAALVFILVAFGGVWLVRGVVAPTESQETQNLKTVKVAKGNIILSANGSSVIQSGNTKEITAISSGKIEEIMVHEGKTVTEGDLLITYENTSISSEVDRLMLDLDQQQSELGDIYDSKSDLSIYAPVSGYISNINNEVGDSISNGYKVGTVINSNSLIINGFFNKSEFDKIFVGDKAKVTVDYYMSTYDGIVVSKNQTPIAKGNGIILYAVSVKIENPGGFTENDIGRVSIEKNLGEIKSYETATFSYSDNKDLTAKASGEVAAINVSNGQYVEKGQLIISMQSSSIDRQIISQQNTISKLNSELEGKLQVLEDSSIYSPITGVITSVNVSPGEQVGSNSILMSISDLNNLEIIIPVDELEINNIEMGMAAKVTVGAVPGKVYQAYVSNIALEGNYSNGVSTFDVTLQINGSDGLKPGMTGEGVIVLDKSESTLLLPIEAVQTNKEGSFIVKADSANDELTPIKIGLVSEYYVEVLEGLSEGEEVKYYTTSAKTSTLIPGTGVPGMGGGIPGMGGGQKGGSSSGGGN